MPFKQTTQQFTPVILGLSLATIDQQAAVEQYLEQSPPPRQAGNIIWLNQIDQPFGIEQWRDLIPNIQSSINNQRLVVTILRADTLSPATQNAMLKTLEEPPAHVQFLLVSIRPNALLPTIQSRCHLLHLDQKNQPVSPAETVDLLNSVVNGSISDALAASDQFKDRDEAKYWLLQTLAWSQQQLGKSSNPEEVKNLDWPTWITALLTAHQQLEQNLHVKLVMDQLFLVLVNKQH